MPTNLIINPFEKKSKKATDGFCPQVFHKQLTLLNKSDLRFCFFCGVGL